MCRSCKLWGLREVGTPHLGHQKPSATAVALTTALTNNAIAENTSTSTRTRVADIGITDDALGTNTITLAGADAASFEVDGTALYLKANVALNFEAKPSYAVTINVADSTVSGSTALSTNYTLCPCYTLGSLNTYCSLSTNNTLCSCYTLSSLDSHITLYTLSTNNSLCTYNTLSSCYTLCPSSTLSSL